MACFEERLTQTRRRPTKRAALLENADDLPCMEERLAELGERSTKRGAQFFFCLFVLKYFPLPLTLTCRPASLYISWITFGRGEDGRIRI